jgi:hypothetical protein
MFWNYQTERSEQEAYSIVEKKFILSTTALGTDSIGLAKLTSMQQETL